MRIKKKFALILPLLFVFMALLATPQQADAAVVTKLAFSMKQVYVETGKSGTLDSIGLRVLATLDNGLEQDVTDDCTLSSAKASVFTVSGQTITAAAKGSAALKAAYGGKTASLSVKVIDTVKQQLNFSADNLTMQNGGSISVKATLEFNDTTLSPLDVTSYCTWTSDDDDIVSVKTGKLKALGLSSDGIGIQAECVLLGSSMSNSMTVKVINPIKSLTAEPFSLSGSEGETYNHLVIKPVYKDGSAGSDVSSSAQFSSTNTKVATVDGSGVVTYKTAGSAYIKAAYAGKTVSIPVKVIAAGGVTLTMIPDVTELQIVAGSSSYIKFKVGTSYVTSYVNLTSSDTSVATTAPGKITALSPGTADITCTYGSATKTFKVTVIKKVSSLSASPSSINIAADQTAQLVLTATYSDKTTGQVTGTCTSGDTGIATLNAAGLVTGKAAGSTKITVTFADKTITVPVTVIAAKFSAITFNTSTSGGTTSPADITYNLATGNTLKVYAQALFDSGSGNSHSDPVTDITSQCVWTSDDTSVATVSGGTVTAKKAGATRITAAFGDKSNSFTVNVWPTISSITATPSTLGFFGNSVTSKSISSIIAKFSDGSERDLLASEISWTSKDTSLVMVSNGTVTLASPFKTGSTSVTGTFAGKTFTVGVSVRPQITDISLSAGSITLITGTPAIFNVMAQYFGGTYSDVTQNCTYTVNGVGDTSKITVDPDKGTITALAGAPASGNITIDLETFSKTMVYTVIPKPDNLGLGLNPDLPGNDFSQEQLITNNGTFYFNMVNQTDEFNINVYSMATPTDDTSRISSSLLSVFSSNNSVATVNKSGNTYTLEKGSATTGSAVVTVYFLDKSFKFTVGIDLTKPNPPAEDGSANKNNSTQSANFNIIVTAETGSSVTAKVGGSNVLNNVTSVTAASNKATLPIAIASLAEGANSIVIIATDKAGNASDPLTVTVTKDTTPPAVPTEDGSANKNGSYQSADFNIIVDAETGSTVTAKVGSINVLDGVTSVTAVAGKATLPIDITKLTEGSNSAIVITATDQAGNASPTLTVTVTKDTTPPAEPAEDGSANKQGTTQSANFDIIVTAETGSTVTATVGGSNVLDGVASVTAVAGKATLPIVITLMSPGSNDIIITAMDQAGNASPQLTVTVNK